MLQNILSIIAGWFSKKETVTQKLEKQFAIMQERYEAQFKSVQEAREKTIKEMDERFDKIEARLNAQIDELEKIVCYRPSCISRVKDYVVNGEKKSLSQQVGKSAGHKVGKSVSK